MIEAGLFNLLSTTAAITAICGTRIYPMVLPPEEINPGAPALTYQIIAATPKPTLDTSGFQRWRIEFNAWGASYGDAVGARKALIQTLDGYQGTLNDGTVLQNAEFLQVIDFFADEQRLYRAMVEFYLYFDFSQ